MKKPAKRPSAKVPAYKNPRQLPDAWVKDLLARLTLPEKAAQMMCIWQEKAQQLVDGACHSEPSIL